VKVATFSCWTIHTRFGKPSRKRRAPRQSCGTTASGQREATIRRPSVVVCQRPHHQDVAGDILAKGGYEHLNLPMEYEASRVVLPSKIGWKDRARKTANCFTPPYSRQRPSPTSRRPSGATRTRPNSNSVRPPSKAACSSAPGGASPTPRQRMVGKPAPRRPSTAPRDGLRGRLSEILVDSVLRSRRTIIDERVSRSTISELKAIAY
jgi:hypothetical protein